jgi:hypothetical protein
LGNIKSKIWGYQKWKIQRNWHHSVHKAKKIKIKTQLLDTITQANTNYVNKTSTLQIEDALSIGGYQATKQKA